MKKWYLICLSVFLLAFTGPLFAQVGNINDEDAILIADMGSQDPADQAPAMEEHMTQGEHHMGMMAHGGHHGHWAGFLNLTEEQKAKMKDLHMQFYTETRGFKYDLMERRIELRRLFLDPKVDAAAVMAKEREVSALRLKVADALAKLMVDCRSVLTPEQLQKIDMMFLSHHAGMRGGMDGHMSMMGGGMCAGMEGHDK